MIQNLRYLRQPDPHQGIDAAVERLLEAGITADSILEPAQHDPRLADPVPDAPTVEDVPVSATRQPVPRPAPGDGLRLMPLAAFNWGNSMPGRLGARNFGFTPRVRGDHILIHVTSGALEVEFPRLRNAITSGRIAFIPAGTAFSLQPPTNIQGYALLIPPHLARDLAAALPLAYCSGLPDVTDQPLLEPALRALGTGSPRNPVEATATSCQLALLAISLSRLTNAPNAQHSLGPQIAEARPLTERFLEIAGETLGESQTMSELARNMGCSLAQLDRACQQSRGRSALELLYTVRLDRAARLLRDGPTPIAQIAQDLGYSGLGHFMRVFAAATGRTPEDFRLSAKMRPASGASKA